MCRVMKVLQEYISECDRDFTGERKILPLHRYLQLVSLCVLNNIIFINNLSTGPVAVNTLPWLFDFLILVDRWMIWKYLLILMTHWRLCVDQY